ncbi:efflux protein [Coprinopsis cinerea okayama7|uniref:Efflux protein n=1 Tax=Coprinopsis cinerea (strain Okayama-7 / 130 / ATCC MYA-4618 / FGSC 9003) TaxID=240176 RepID=A8NVU7_COPC7|nr:efflux protein [Coprinopsis cinerea okayama7\|eukprot:XP_001836758.2 efflux protein [Coprinopsis cinerea okayama7\
MIEEQQRRRHSEPSLVQNGTDESPTASTILSPPPTTANSSRSDTAINVGSDDNINGFRGGSPAASTSSRGGKASAPSSSKLKSVLVVMTMTTAMMINIANSTSVSIALPTIGRELGLHEADLQWLVSAYPLSSGCLLLAFGRLADLYGRKLTFILGSAFLTAFTLACAFPSDIIALNILRGVQGLGAAATIPASVGILAHHFPPGKARSWAFATFSAGAPVGGIFGSAVGGVLTEFTAKTWRSSFYLMAGMTFLSMVCGVFCIRSDTPPVDVDKRIDWLGALIISAGLVLIVFVLGQGEIAPNKWATPYIIALLIVGVILVAAFLYWQRYLEKVQNDPNAPYSVWTPPPLMKMSIWTRGNGRFSAMMAIAFLEWCCFLGWSFWIQLYYQNYVGLTPLKTVLRLLPMTVSGILCNIFIGIFVARIPIVYLTVIGTGATAVACLLFAIIEPEVTFWAYGFPAAVLVVLGADFIFSAGTIYVAKVAQLDEQSVAGGLFNTMTQLGTALGVTVSTVVYNSISARAGPDADPLPAYHAAQWANFAFGVIGAILAFVFFRGVGVVGDRQKKPAVEEEGVREEEKLGDETPRFESGTSTPMEKEQRGMGGPKVLGSDLKLS